MNHGENRLGKKVADPSELWNNIKWSKILVLWVSERLTKRLFWWKLQIYFALFSELQGFFSFQKTNTPMKFISCYILLFYFNSMLHINPNDHLDQMINYWSFAVLLLITNLCMVGGGENLQCGFPLLQIFSAVPSINAPLLCC